MRPLRVLLIEDSEDDADLVITALSSAGWQVSSRRVADARALHAALVDEDWDVVLSDHMLPGLDSFVALAVVRESGRDLPFILVSGTIGEERAAEMMRAGAHDYVMKGNLVRLGPAVERELREADVRRERHRAQLRLEEDAQVFDALARVGRRVIACSDSAALHTRLGELMIEVLGCDSSFTLVRTARDTFVPAFALGGSAAQLEELRALKLPADAVRDLLEALREHETVQVLNRAPRTPWAALPLRFGVTSMLYFALRQGDEVFGIQAVGFRGRSERFTPQQERIARGSAQLASLALRTTRLIEEVAQANRVKAEFAATMSHELRTPLNVIIGFNSLLLAGDLGPVTPEQADALQRTDRGAQRLLELISAILDLSRLDLERDAMNVLDADIPALLLELQEETCERAQQARLLLSCVVPTDLPRLRTDVAKLKAVLRNLLSNALKFTGAGTVLVRSAARDSGIEISVAASGTGIAPEVLPIIFDLFRQGDGSASRRFGGVGVGLYIAKRLVGMLRGTIAVEATPGGGATFRVWVPSLPGGDETKDDA